MHQGLIESSNSEPPTNHTSSSSPPVSQHGILRPEPSLSEHESSGRSSSAAIRSSSGADPASSVDLDHLGRGLDRLSLFNDSDTDSRTSPVSAGAQRISDYENALITSARHVPRPPVGFQVIKCPGSSDGAKLTDCPNEILTQILSHLHPDSHGAIALVSKRFYALVTTPYAWRAAFLRYFSGQDALTANTEGSHHTWDNDSSDMIRSESRYFSRLTSLATWRSEYLLRTRLLRSVARGKPGGVGISTRSSQSGKKSSAVLTYNSKLPWLITNLHGSFTGGKKGPRITHGAADLGVGSSSDPTIGKVDKWGLDDPFSFAQLDEMFPNLQPYGAGDGPAAVPNVMDVSQPYGVVGGEGFPGGRVHFRATGELRGRYLSQDSAIINMIPEIPKIPELSDAVSSLWVAKSSSVPSMTQSMIGILAGSTLGVVTSYAVGYDSSGPRFNSGDMTARWVLSPGVPIVDIKVDDSYSQKRKALGRVWAVALNALGEVFYLRQTPTPPLARTKGEEAIRAAWEAGRTVSWEHIDSTRRAARADEYDKNAVRGTYSPRSSANSMNLTKPQIIAEALEIEKFFRLKPAHFRKVCEGWDMRRKLEVDFADGDEANTGEAIFVITCGHEEEERAAICKYVRSKAVNISAVSEAVSELLSPAPVPDTVGASLFGGTKSLATAGQSAHGTPNDSQSTFQAPTPNHGSATPDISIDEWRRTEYIFKNTGSIVITATATDASSFAVMAPFEDPLHFASNDSATDSTTVARPKKQATGEIPGRRSRMLAIGTNTGSIILWNMRDSTSSQVVNPTRVIQTESPEISSLALTALYLIHGGSDGLVQAWDPLASTLDPIRTLNAKSSGRIPRHILNANPALQDVNYFAVGAIFLDPDPAVLRGVLAFGTFIRYWTYSSTNQGAGRKRRARHSDVHGRLTTRRLGGTVNSYIAAEEAELRRDQDNRSRELTRLRSRFGVGLGDLTEEEAIRYAEMISEEAFLQEEMRRTTSASDTGSTAETGSSTGSIDTVTPEPSLSGASPITGSLLPPLQEEPDADYEAQIQRAIRLSLLEGVNDAGQSPRENSSGGYEFEVKVKPKREKTKKKAGRSSSTSPSASTPVVEYGEASSRDIGFVGGELGVDEDDDLALALRLSLEEEQARSRLRGGGEVDGGAGLGIRGEDDFPGLEVTGKGKGRCV